MGGATTTTTAEQPPPAAQTQHHAPPSPPGSPGAALDHAHSPPASPRAVAPTPLTKQLSPASEYEAILTGVMALAQLFATCVEAFGLITPNHKWEKEEQLLLSRLGLQQARLLIWGHVVGICSPPATVTDRAIPKHPSAAYPDLTEPTFFGARDERLEEAGVRVEIEKALAALVDRTSGSSREEVMAQYGLKPPKKGGLEYASPVDMNRLEAFRERYELLKEVAESYAQLNVRRNRSLMSSTSWQVADYGRFDAYLKLTQEKIDFLIESFGAKDRVDRGMRMDIKALGWHLTADRARVATDVSKLKLIKEHCAKEYPEYVDACNVALANIERERKENVGVYNPYAGVSVVPSMPTKVKSPKRHSVANGSPNGAAHKRASLFGGLLKSFGKKSRDGTHPHAVATRSKSVSAAASGTAEQGDAERSMSDVGPLRSGSEDSMGGGLAHVRSKSFGGHPHDLSTFASNEPSPGNQAQEAPVEKFRSKSIGDVLEIRPELGDDEDEVRERLQRLVTKESTAGDNGVGVGAGEDGEKGGELSADGVGDVDVPALKKTETMGSAVSRHDQYHGIARQGTKNQ